MWHGVAGINQLRYTHTRRRRRSRERKLRALALLSAWLACFARAAHNNIHYTSVSDVYQEESEAPSRAYISLLARAACSSRALDMSGVFSQMHRVLHMYMYMVWYTLLCTEKNECLCCAPPLGLSVVYRTRAFVICMHTFVSVHKHVVCLVFSLFNNE